MMSHEEVSILDSIAPTDNLSSLLDAPEIQNLNPTHIEDVLFVSAILYFAPTHWTVWINNKTYTADETEDAILKITKVTNSYIMLELKSSLKKITKLRANQSLVTFGHYVVDGDARQKQKSIQL